MELFVQLRQRLGERVADKTGQAVPQVSPLDSRLIARRDAAHVVRHFSREEVADQLRGRGVAPAAGAERRFLQSPLERDARERAVAAEILRRNRYQQSAVDVFAVAGKLAHAVGHDAPDLGRARDHLPAGADAEREHAASVARMIRQLVRRRRQRGIPRRLLVLRRVNGALLVLDAHADRERLRLHRHAEGVERFKRIPRAVTERKHGLPRL